MGYTEIAATLGVFHNGMGDECWAGRAVVAALTRRAKQTPLLRKFGVEIETVGADRPALAEAIFGVVGYHVPIFGYHGNRCECCGREYSHQEKLTVWHVERDGSLRHGASYHRNTGEVVSPILVGESGFAEIERVLAAIRAVGATTNRSTGLHVHVDASDLSGIEVSRVVEYYTMQGRNIDTLVSRSRHSNNYANKYASYQIASMKQIVERDGREGLRGFAHKYRTVNLLPLFSYGTIEFRQHQGSVNAQKVISWVRFVQALIVAAQQAIDLDQSISLDGLVDVMVEKAGLVNDAATYLKSTPRRLGYQTA